MKEKKIFQQLTSEDVYQIYKLLLKEKLVSFPITKDAEHKIDSLVSSINNNFFGDQVYKTNAEKAVAYLYFLIKDHPFTDGNKRTAILCFGVICDLNNLTPKYDGFALDELAVFIEQTKPGDYQLFIRQLAELILSQTKKSNLHREI